MGLLVQLSLLDCTFDHDQALFEVLGVVQTIQGGREDCSNSLTPHA